MLNLLTGHTYTIKLKWTNADGSLAAPPASKGTVTYVGGGAQINSVTLVDPVTVQVITAIAAGVAAIMVQSPDHMSVAYELLNVSLPPTPAPAVASFDETTLTQTV